MDKIKWYLRHFMDGRNGMDECAKTSMIGACIIMMISNVLRSAMVHLLAWMMFVYGLYRIFSRDVRRRSEENHTFLSYLQLGRMNFEQRKTHRIYLCKNCKRKIRVPKGKGKIEITCPSCGCKMIHHT
jgi:DNA-directed RNA polymerase subunit RPC12/RpoP